MGRLAAWKVYRRDEAGFDAWALSSGAGDEAVVLPALGGTVRSLSLAGCPGLLRADEDEELSANPLFRGRLLFPFNDRIPGGRYAFNGKEYRLPVNDELGGAAIHGFLYRKSLSLVGAESRSDSASLRLRYDLGEGEEEGYPFPLSLDVEYRLDARGFSLTMSARNTGRSAAPLAYGWHPYLALPGKADGWTLRHGADRYVPVGADLLPLGGPASVDGTPYDYRGGKRLGADPLDLALCAARGSTVVSSEAGSIAIASSMPPFAYTQLYIPPQRDSIAVEPVTGATDSFNRPALGLIGLAPGAESSGSIRVSAEFADRTPGRPL